MKPLFLCLLAAGALSLSVQSSANRSIFSYQHDYFTQNRFHTDKLNFDYYLDNGLAIGVGVNAFNKAKDVFDNPSLHSTVLKTAYEYRVTDAFSIRPRMEFMFYAGTNPNGSSIPAKADWSGEIGDNGTSGTKYKPGMTFIYKPSNALNLSLDYEYNLRKLSRYYRNEETQPKYAGDDHRTHIIGIGVNYRPNRYWTIDYVAHYLDGDYTLYNNKQHDYDQQLKIFYRVNRDWQPFVSIQDKAAKTDTSMREAVIGGGVMYYF